MLDGGRIVAEGTARRAQATGSPGTARPAAGRPGCASTELHDYLGARASTRPRDADDRRRHRRRAPPTSGRCSTSSIRTATRIVTGSRCTTASLDDVFFALTRDHTHSPAQKARPRMSEYVVHTHSVDPRAAAVAAQHRRADHRAGAAGDADADVRRTCSAARSAPAPSTSTTSCRACCWCASASARRRRRSASPTTSTSGIIDRFRSMDVRGEALISGHVVASVARNLLSAALVVVVALAIGFRPQRTCRTGCRPPGSWRCSCSRCRGSRRRSASSPARPEAAQGITFLISFLPYASSAFVPIHTMPVWLQGFARNQPVTAVVDAIRASLGGAPRRRRRVARDRLERRHHRRVDRTVRSAVPTARAVRWLEPAASG